MLRVDRGIQFISRHNLCWTVVQLLSIVFTLQVKLMSAVLVPCALAVHCEKRGSLNLCCAVVQSIERELLVQNYVLCCFFVDRVIAGTQQLLYAPFRCVDMSCSLVYSCVQK